MGMQHYAEIKINILNEPNDCTELIRNAFIGNRMSTIGSFNGEISFDGKADYFVSYYDFPYYEGREIEGYSILLAKAIPNSTFNLYAGIGNEGSGGNYSDEVWASYERGTLSYKYSCGYDKESGEDSIDINTITEIKEYIRIPESDMSLEVPEEFVGPLMEGIKKVYDMLTEEYLANCDYFKLNSYPKVLEGFDIWNDATHLDGTATFTATNTLRHVDPDYIRIFFREIILMYPMMSLDFKIVFKYGNANGKFNMHLFYNPHGGLMNWCYLSTMSSASAAPCDATCPDCGLSAPFFSGYPDYIDPYYCPKCGSELICDESVEREHEYTDCVFEDYIDSAMDEFSSHEVSYFPANNIEKSPSELYDCNDNKVDIPPKGAHVVLLAAGPADRNILERCGFIYDDKISSSTDLIILGTNRLWYRDMNENAIPYSPENLKCSGNDISDYESWSLNGCPVEWLMPEGYNIPEILPAIDAMKSAYDSGLEIPYLTLSYTWTGRFFKR